MDFQEEQNIQSRRRIAGEHARAELSARGIWICPCAACVEARKVSAAAAKNGFCLHCGAPLDKRKGAKYCCVNHRVAAYEQRKRKGRNKAPLPLFEPNTFDFAPKVG
jgi:hypothetical protein